MEEIIKYKSSFLSLFKRESPAVKARQKVMSLLETGRLSFAEANELLGGLDNIKVQNFTINVDNSIHQNDVSNWGNIGTGNSKSDQTAYR